MLIIRTENSFGLCWLSISNTQEYFLKKHLVIFEKNALEKGMKKCRIFHLNFSNSNYFTRFRNKSYDARLFRAMAANVFAKTQFDTNISLYNY